VSDSRAPSPVVVQAFDRPIQFGFGIAPGANAHLQRAAQLVSRREDSLAALQDAYVEAPEQVETLVAMFKLRFYQGETDRAESLVLEALEKASRQGGFSSDWRELQSTTSDWEDPRGSGRLYLYSLKALAFIRLRQDDLEQARSILQAMQQIDPADQVGAEVIRDLLRGVEGESGDG
jgi:cytochrome c-type biogenesis protein CcmH/NrfG